MTLQIREKVMKGKTSDSQLPENVTEKPRSKEEMNLKPIKKSPKAVRAYLQVSDDQGELLGSKIMERKIKQFCDQYENVKASEIKNLEEVIQEVKDLATLYTLQINTVENSINGTITKYRIRQGMLFIIMKKLVKKNKGNWIEWFKTNFDGREFRSVQDYMKLARTPGIIRYAFLGKERLLQILRQLTDEDKGQEDPVGAFLGRNVIDFNPEEELDAHELRVETDVAINYQKLLDEGITEIPKELIDVLVRNGKDLEAKHIINIKAAKEVDQDHLVEYMKEIIAGDGRVEPVMTPDRKAEGFKKTANRFLKAIENALEDGDYLGQFDQESFNGLKEKVLELEQRVSTN